MKKLSMVTCLTLAVMFAGCAKDKTKKPESKSQVKKVDKKKKSTKSPMKKMDNKKSMKKETTTKSSCGSCVKKTK